MITIHQAKAEEAPKVTVMVGELLNEIMEAVGVQAFNFSGYNPLARLTDYIRQEKYFVFVAHSGSAGPLGFIALSESYALYTEGVFGIIPEFYVRPAFRSRTVGAQLLAQAIAFGTSRHWTRLEVTTPPLPQFEKSLAFYEREGFAVSGGRKLRMML